MQARRRALSTATVPDLVERSFTAAAPNEHAASMAITARSPLPSPDGAPPTAVTQYICSEFGKALRASGLLASMGQIGSGFDNALAESAFATLKTELLYRRSWPTRQNWSRRSRTSRASTTPDDGTPGSATSARSPTKRCT